MADPVFELIGAYRSRPSLIDDIPVSEDPDLPILAAKLGPDAHRRHAWEIAPHHYKRGMMSGRCAGIRDRHKLLLDSGTLPEPDPRLRL